MWSAPVFVMYHILSVSVRTDSNPKLSAIASAVVIITNITLDLFFMKLLDLGIIGASSSLCISETLGVLVLLTHFLKKHRLLKFRLVLPKLSDIGSFIYNGFGMGSEHIFDAVVMLVFNTLLLRFGRASGTLYVAIYGVIYTISTIFIGVFDGASDALLTVSAFLVGESDTDGIYTVLRKVLSVVIVSGGIITLFSTVFSDAFIMGDWYEAILLYQLYLRRAFAQCN